MSSSHPKRTESRSSSAGTSGEELALCFWWPVHGCLRESGLNTRVAREFAISVLRNFSWRREEGHAGTSGRLRLALFAAVLDQLQPNPTHSRSFGGFIFESTSNVPAQAESRMLWSIRGQTPLERFSHRCGISLLECALEELEVEAEALHSMETFQRIRLHLDRNPAGELSDRDGTFQALVAARTRFRDLLFKKIRMTLTDDNNFQSEWKALYG